MCIKSLNENFIQQPLRFYIAQQYNRSSAIYIQYLCLFYVLIICDCYEKNTDNTFTYTSNTPNEYNVYVF